MADYCTTAELKAQIDKIGAGDDAVIAAIITAASRAIDNFCNRPDEFVALASATARTYAGSGKPYQLIDECVEITVVAVKDSATDTSYDTWAATDYIACSGDPEAPDFNRLPYTMIMVDPTGDEAVFTSGKYITRGGFKPLTDTSRGVPTVRVTAKWGYSVAVPEGIKQACIVQAATWYKRGQSGWSKILASNDLGQLAYDIPLDPAVEFILQAGRYIMPAMGRR